MGNCFSVELLEARVEAKDLSNVQLSDQSTTQTAINRFTKKSVRYGFWNRKKILIYNNSRVHASFAITAGPISNISSISIDSIGGITFDKKGADKVQKFKLLSQRPRFVRIHSNFIFVTVYLFVNNEWRQLWVNREFYQLDNISLQNYHIEEACIDSLYDGINVDIQDE